MSETDSPTLDDRIQRVLAYRAPWWVWNAFLVVLAISALGTSLLLQPGSGEWVYFQGQQVGETCAAIQITGKPCPQCGMTRSFVYGARFRVLEAFLFNPAGYALFLWIQVGGVLGAYRLARRDGKAAELPWELVAGWTMFWFIGLWALPWVARLFGVNPLPGT